MPEFHHLFDEAAVIITLKLTSSNNVQKVSVLNICLQELVFFIIILYCMLTFIRQTNFLHRSFYHPSLLNKTDVNHFTIIATRETKCDYYQLYRNSTL